MKNLELSEIKVKLFGGGKAPEYKHVGDACADCTARLAEDSITIPKDGRCLVNLGFAIELPAGYEAVIRPRSGLSKRGIDIAIGTVDESYRGEVAACVINNSGGDYVVHHGDRICQMKVQMAERFTFVPVSELSDTERGTAGWGSTGV